MNILTVVLTCTFMTIAWLFGLVLYRLTLHPLAKYPGPFFSKISGFSIVFQNITQRRHLILLREHQLYGPIVRIAPNTLSFSAPDALRQIYQPGRHNNQLRKADWYEIIDAPIGAFSLHTELSRRKHTAHRKILDRAFSTAALRTYDPLIEDAVETLKGILAPDEEDSWSLPRNMKDYANWFTYDVMGALVFGRRFDCMTDSTHRSVPKIMMASSAFTYIVGYFPFQSIVRRVISSSVLMGWLGGELGRDEHAYVQYATDCMSERLEKKKVEDNKIAQQPRGIETKDMMHFIINANNAETGAGARLTRAELDADASLLIAAGSDTTSVTIAALMFYLTLPMSRHMLQKLQAEIRDHTTFPSASSITVQSTIALPYLRACLDEALRLAPSVPTHLPRTIATQPGIVIDSVFVPSGTTVGASAYVMHHNEHVFPRSWEFDPERWLVDPCLSQLQKEEKEERIRKARQSFIPFSLGSRGCIGRELAYREMSYCMVHLVHAFDFRRVNVPSEAAELHGSMRSTRLFGNKVNEAREEEYALYDCFLADRFGPQVQFRRAQWRDKS